MNRIYISVLFQQITAKLEASEFNSVWSVYTYTEFFLRVTRMRACNGSTVSRSHAYFTQFK